MKISIKICSGIYKIENIKNNKCYIGLSTCIPTRWQYHRLNLNKNRHTNSGLQDDWNFFGPSCFMFCLLEYVPHGDILPAKEKYWINQYKSIGEIYNRVY